MSSLDDFIYGPDNVKEYAQCTPRPIRIIHVGAGASGLLFAHKVEKRLENFELTVDEKNDVIGGTWYENKYPGCACDIAAHSYVFPFEPNPEWSGYFSYGDEIQTYMLKFAKKYGVEKYIKLNTEVISATWNQAEGLWMVDLRRSDGSTFSDTCNVLVNGAGVVNRWKWPDVEGLHDFKGSMVHSANWDSKVDWSGKSVAVIGSGSSSVQIVPEVVKTASHVSVFIRNKTYIAPVLASVTNTEADPDASNPAAVGKHKYTEKEKQRFRDDPEYHLQYRRTLERTVVGGFRAMHKGSDTNNMMREWFVNSMRTKLNNREDLLEKIVPDWSPGCRRLTPGEGYLEALVQPNVTCVFDHILKVTQHGLITTDGQEHKVDILICATGFNVQFFPHYKMVGVDGQILQDQTVPNVYASVATPGFPNYFIVNGPRGNWGQGCALPSHETQIEYIVQCCRKIQEDGIRSMAPKKDVTTQLNLYMDAWHRKTSVWAEPCKSWYKDNKPNGRVYVWAGSLLHHLKFMKRPRFEHYDIEYLEPNNIWAFLGNGATRTDEKHEKIGNIPVPYIRNDEDEEWDIV